MIEGALVEGEIVCVACLTCARCRTYAEETFLTASGRCCSGCLTIEEQLACGLDATPPPSP